MTKQEAIADWWAKEIAAPLLYDKTATGRDLEPWFSKHMMAMTAEGLHAKSEIAVELARRDKRIEKLLKELEDYEDQLNYAVASGGRTY